MPDVHRKSLSAIIDPIVRERELSAVMSVLAHPFTQADMDSWMSAESERNKVFHDAFWGNIRWPKSIGRSAGASLADGFSFSLQFHYFQSASGPDGNPTNTADDWNDLPSPIAWEADDDADHYRVVYSGFYVSYGPHVDKNALKVRIAGTWTNPTRLPRYLLPNPIGWGFGSFDGSPIVLDDMTVDEHVLEPVPRWVVRL